ncbi:hypothetical protein BOTBODRAFT_173600 [Botryobasidium botryosum FD-172 SS1]|uniref:Dystroglycan-type cadherin-like domain-containing protein n=1 Tax=Botryobasidium botryosum (strain FD-172 SS1) TaxID=930990 RepID=A0A067MMK2_BOTB1|nr:hypothetical protein BOTBODRAFT_173600 [Botryobasidium botryosum FD-172 SS1]
MPHNAIFLAALGASFSFSFAQAKPTLAVPFAAQINPLNSTAPSADISSARRLPSGGGIRVPSGWSFSIGFQPDTFSSNQTLVYSAHTLQEDYLPDWLHFDPRTLTFTGVAPWSDSQPHTFTVVVTCTEEDDKDHAEDSFVIEIAPQDSVIELPSPKPIDTTARHAINYVLDMKGMIGKDAGHIDDLDASMVVDMDLRNASWLDWNASSLTLSGNTPDTLLDDVPRSILIPVTIRDDDTLQKFALSLELRTHPYPFRAFTLPDTFVDPGAPVLVDISPYIAIPLEYVQVHYEFEPKAAELWLFFNSTSLSFQGQVPNISQITIVTIWANDTRTGLTSSAQWLIVIASSPTTTPFAAPALPSHSGKPHPIVAIVASILGGVAILAIAIVVIFYRRRASKRADAPVALPVQAENAQSLSSFDGPEDEKKAIPTLISQGTLPSLGSASEANPYQSFRIKVVDTGGAASRTHAESASVPALQSVGPHRLGMFSIFDQLDAAAPPPRILTPNSEPRQALPSIETRSSSGSGPHFSVSVPAFARLDPSLETASMTLALHRPRSVNSAYSSLASWETESTWFADRRRRPPSPCWRSPNPTERYEFPSPPRVGARGESRELVGETPPGEREG